MAECLVPALFQFPFMPIHIFIYYILGSNLLRKTGPEVGLGGVGFRHLEVAGLYACSASDADLSPEGLREALVDPTPSPEDPDVVIRRPPTIEGRFLRLEIEHGLVTSNYVL